MTIETPILQVEKYAGDGVTKTFGFGFRTFSTADVVVVATDASGVESVLNPESDFYITSNSSGIGGTVTLASALPKNAVLVIIRKIPIKQEIDLVNQGEFYAETIETAFDRLTAIAQDMYEQLGRTLVVPITENSTPQQLLNEILNVASTANVYAAEAKTILDKAQVIDRSVSSNAQSVSLMKTSVDESERNVAALASRVNEYSDELELVSNNLEAIEAVSTQRTAIQAIANDLQGYPVYEFDGGEVGEPNESMTGVGGVMRICAENIEAIRRVSDSIVNGSSLTNLAEVVDEIGSTDYVAINETGQTEA